jgi:isopropylmalate/homocitrate/citramalate synthase
VLKGIQQMAGGHLDEGLTRAFPLQLGRDVQHAVTGKHSGQELSPYERILEGIGFTPQRVAEGFDERRKSQAEGARRVTDRKSLERAYRSASSPVERAKLVTQMRKWNDDMKAAHKPREMIYIKSLEKRQREGVH